ncbi:MAG: DsrE family protein [Marmoricola sp.]
MTRRLLVKATAGSDDPERCNQAFTVAAAAVAAGAEVSLWLTGEAAWFAVPGRAEAFELELATPLSELLSVVLQGGQVTVCTQCAQRRGLVEGDLVLGVRIAGAPAFVEEALTEGVQALVY